MGGQLSVRSAAGSGSCFSCEIPGSLLRPARYMVSAIARIAHVRLDEHDHALSFDVIPIGATRNRRGVITPILPWAHENAYTA